ncbi:hypothetical protein JHW43_006367 [Diplocarpon mali]|nr:hypothetical protein JHW43_006367 [Diplocarpon mali]
MILQLLRALHMNLDYISKVLSEGDEDSKSSFSKSFPESSSRDSNSRPSVTLRTREDFSLKLLEILQDRKRPPGPTSKTLSWTSERVVSIILATKRNTRQDRYLRGDNESRVGFSGIPIFEDRLRSTISIATYEAEFQQAIKDPEYDITTAQMKNFGNVFYDKRTLWKC